MSLSPKQQKLANNLTDIELKFCNFYLDKATNKKSNAQCLLDAGFKANNAYASSAASRLLKKAKIADYLNAMKEVIVEDAIERVSGSLVEVLEALRVEAGLAERPCKPTGVGDNGEEKEQEVFNTTPASRVNALKTLAGYYFGADRNIEPFDLGEGSDTDKISRINKAMADGRISTGVGKALIDGVKAKVAVQDVAEHARQIEELKKILESS